MATIALFVTLGGTAFAAITITGRNIKDSTLTAADFKAGTLALADLSASAKASLVGAQGATGRTGSTGSTGARGGVGSQGPRGSAAYLTSAFAFRDTGVFTSRQDALIPNENSGGASRAWDDPNYADLVGTPGSNAQLKTDGNYHRLDLGQSESVALALTGMSAGDATKSTDQLLNVSFDGGYLLATATVTLLHRANGEDLSTNSGGTVLHGRAECALYYGTSTNPALLTTRIGVPVQVSAGEGGLNHELVQVSLTGNAGTAAATIPAGGQYNVTVKCRDVDATGNASPQWQVASGNLTAMVSR
jgi:hypothetical protein